MCANDSGIKPTAPASLPPSMVWLLPDPVCPYANTVPLKPASTPSTMGAAALAYTSACAASGPYTASNVNVRTSPPPPPPPTPTPEGADGCAAAPPAPDGASAPPPPPPDSSRISRRAALAVTATTRPLARSPSDSGRTRTTTRTHSPPPLEAPSSMAPFARVCVPLFGRACCSAKKHFSAAPASENVAHCAARVVRAHITADAVLRSHPHLNTCSLATVSAL